MYEKGSALRRNPALANRNGLRFPCSDLTSFATRNALLLVSTFDRYRAVTSLPERTGHYYNPGMETRLSDYTTHVTGHVCLSWAQDLTDVRREAERSSYSIILKLLSTILEDPPKEGSYIPIVQLPIHPLYFHQLKR